VFEIINDATKTLKTIEQLLNTCLQVVGGDAK